MVDRPASEQASRRRIGQIKNRKGHRAQWYRWAVRVRVRVCVVGTPGDGNAMERRGRVTEIKDVPFSLRQRQW